MGEAEAEYYKPVYFLYAFWSLRCSRSKGSVKGIGSEFVYVIFHTPKCTNNLLNTPVKDRNYRCSYFIPGLKVISKCLDNVEQKKKIIMAFFNRCTEKWILFLSGRAQCCSLHWTDGACGCFWGTVTYFLNFSIQVWGKKKQQKGISPCFTCVFVTPLTL